MHGMKRVRLLTIVLLLPLMAAGCAGESVPPSSAEEASSAQTLDTSTSSGAEATSLMTEEISSTGAESTRRSDPSVTAARTMEPTSRPTTAPVSTSSVSTATTAKTPPEGFLTQALFAAGRDAYGSKSINILGDSISHGANAPNIPED